jgi:hypothetical protein
MNADGSIDIIMSSREGKDFAALKLMTGLLGKPHFTQCQGPDYFCGRNCQETAAE